MDLLWHVNWQEMLGDLIVTSFLVLLDASIVVVVLMGLWPLCEFKFKRKQTRNYFRSPPPWHHDGLRAHWQFSGRSWLAMRSDFSLPDVMPLLSEGKAPARIVYLSDHRSVSSPGNHRTILVKQSANRIGASVRAAILTQSQSEKVGEHREIASG